METTSLLVNLVIALLAGLTGAIIAVRLRQSVILGYILAGIAIGPFTPGVTSDVATVEALADIGIILLLFAIGVQFSLRDLLRAGKVVTLGGTAQVLVIIGVGFGVGIALGWEPLEALFFGAVLSNSSSTVLSKVLGERGEMGAPHGQLALAWSTVQDLGTIILIVVLSALARGSDDLLTDLAVEVGKAALFLALLVPIGLRVLPTVFERVAGLRNREIFVLTVAVVALGLAYGASLFGLSLALGAFVVGVVVSESDLSHQILGEVLPLRDIFSGLFFVSVGMLVDPVFVARNLPLLLVTLAIIIFVKGALIAILATLLGTPSRTAVLAGAILAQSAEFSFLLARAGADLGAVTPTVFSLMLAGAAVSIILVPTVYQASLPLAGSLGGWRSAPTDAAMPLVGPEPGTVLRGHAVICGYGRVGQVIGAVLRHRFAFVVIEEDPRIVRRLRSEGIPVIQGNAAVPAVLARANLERASLLVGAIPDPVATRQIVDQARRLRPRLHIIARTHSEAERRFLLGRGVDAVVLGEWELALAMGQHALRGFGVSSVEAQAVIHHLRGRASVDPPGTVRAPDSAGRHPSSRSEAEALPGSGRSMEVERQEETKEKPVARRLHDGVSFLGGPHPADGGNVRVDVDEQERRAGAGDNNDESRQRAPQSRSASEEQAD